MAAPTVTAAGDTTATVQASVTPRGADVWVSAQYGAHYEHSTRSMRVGGETARPVTIDISGLTPGRTRNVRVVAWSSYGVRHSAPVRVATTDTSRRPSGPLAAKGSADSASGCGSGPIENSLQVAALGEVMAGTTRDRPHRVGAPVPQHLGPPTYFFSFRMPTGVRATSWCVRVYDRAGHRSERRCARSGVGTPARAPSAHPFS